MAVPSPQQRFSSLADARLHKLTLEIQRLEGKGKPGESLKQWTPLISVLIAVGGFLFGIYQFQSQQKTQQTQTIEEQQKDRRNRAVDQRIRIQSQIRADLEQLLQFPRDRQQTISKAVFLLEDLKSQLRINVDEAQDNADATANNKRMITVSLVETVEDDCNFTEPRDVDFATIVVENWDDYEQYLKEEPEKLEFILGKYIEALEHIYSISPAVVRTAEYNPATRTYAYQGGSKAAELSGHFQNTISGFRLHLALLPDESKKAPFMKEFQAALCNPALTEQVLGVKFNQRVELGIFRRCL